jgi:hypothetical protein
MSIRPQGTELLSEQQIIDWMKVRTWTVVAGGGSINADGIYTVDSASPHKFAVVTGSFVLPGIVSFNNYVILPTRWWTWKSFSVLSPDCATTLRQRISPTLEQTSCQLPFETPQSPPRPSSLIG